MSHPLTTLLLALKRADLNPDSPDLNPLDFHVWGAMLAEYEAYQLKPKKTAELKIVLQSIWDKLPQDAIDKAVLSFRKRLQACVTSDGGHFEHALQ